MKNIIILLAVSAVAVGCNRNRVGDERGYVEPEATDRTTIMTGTSRQDAQTAGPGTATGPGEETSGGAYGTGRYVPGPAGSQPPGQQAPQGQGQAPAPAQP
ncbi:MAG: hypothetical protein ACK4UN_18905 [Limisphaerales bacterium]